MNEMMLAAISANAKDEDKAIDHLNQMELAYYVFEPFLDEKTSAEVVAKYTEFTHLCLKFTKADPASEEYKNLVDQLVSIKTYFRVRLFTVLFARR